jgi:hypothetical protein
VARAEAMVERGVELKRKGGGGCSVRGSRNTGRRERSVKEEGEETKNKTKRI